MVINKTLDVNVIENEVLKSILEYYGQNIARASKETGIPRGKFYRNKE